MDTYMQITAYGKNAEKAVSKAKQRINELDQMLSTGKENSEVSQLNNKKTLKLSSDVGNIMGVLLKYTKVLMVCLIPQFILLCRLGDLTQKNIKFQVRNVRENIKKY